MSAPDETQIESETTGNPNPTSTPGDRKVRTLHEPPDIWDLVHETRAEFKPGSAFVGHLTAPRNLISALILLIIAGGAVFWFTKSQGPSANSTAAPPKQAESHTETVLSAPPTLSKTNESTSNQSSSVTPPAAHADEPKRAGAAPATSSVNNVEKPKSTEAVSITSSVSNVTAKPRRQNPTTATGTPVAGTRNKDRAQTSTLNTTGSAPAADNKDAGQTSVGLKSAAEKSAYPPATKKDTEKALGPQLIAPPKTSPTPKAKVIPWP